MLRGTSPTKRGQSSYQGWEGARKVRPHVRKRLEKEQPGGGERGRMGGLLLKYHALRTCSIISGYARMRRPGASGIIRCAGPWHACLHAYVYVLALGPGPDWHLRAPTNLPSLGIAGGIRTPSTSHVHHGAPTRREPCPILPRGRCRRRSPLRKSGLPSPLLPPAGSSRRGQVRA